MDAHEPVTVTTGTTQLPEVDVVGASPGLFSAVDADVTWADPSRPSLGPGQVLIGETLAKNLELGPLDLSPVIRVGGLERAVAGVVRGSSRLPQLAGVVTMPISDANIVSQTDSTTIYITTVGGAAPQVARQAPILIDPVNPDVLQTEAPPDPVSLRGAIEGDVRAALLAVTVVALFAAILGVANSMLLSVIERIGELGLRRAIGARPAHILTQTSLESVVAGLLGGLVGLATGMTVILTITIINHWQPVLDLRLVPAALAGGALVGILGGLPASWRASRVQPADALRQ
jgi:macrolide transport system ATP-binding/permease protein